jgi:hypothetical protein
MGFTEAEAQGRKGEIDTLTLEALRRMLREKANNVTWLMERRFNKVFKMDSDGLPRKWGRGEDVKGEFLRARQCGESVLDQVSVLRLLPQHRDATWFEPRGSGSKNTSLVIKTDPTSVPDEAIVLPLHETTRVLETFREGCQGAYIQALSDQENSASMSTTAWIVAVTILVFGWNEIYWIISNPILLFLFVVFGGAGTLWARSLPERLVFRLF